MARDYGSDYRAIFLYTIVMLNLKDTISKIQSSNRSLFILCGFPYSGKSHLANQLTQVTDIKVIAVDDIFKKKGFDWTDNKLPNPTEWQEIFEESYDAAHDALKQGKNVLYDSTNHTKASRDALREVAASVGASSYVLYIKTPTEVVFERWMKNQNSPSRPQVSEELVQATIDTFEEPQGEENVIVICNG